MRWRDELKSRKMQVEALYIERNRIDKKIKSAGTTDCVEFIAEAIERDLGYPCRVKRYGKSGTRFLELYKKNATEKQIKYGYCNIGELRVFGDDKNLQFEGISSYDCRDMPDEVSEIFDLLVLSGNRGQWHEWCKKGVYRRTPFPENW